MIRFADGAPPVRRVTVPVPEETPETAETGTRIARACPPTVIDTVTAPPVAIAAGGAGTSTVAG